jgi:hypothetical protein
VAVLRRARAVRAPLLIASRILIPRGLGLPLATPQLPEAAIVFHMSAPRLIEWFG